MRPPLQNMGGMPNMQMGAPQMQQPPMGQMPQQIIGQPPAMGGPPQMGPPPTMGGPPPTMGGPPQMGPPPTMGGPPPTMGRPPPTMGGPPMGGPPGGMPPSVEEQYNRMFASICRDSNFKPMSEDEKKSKIGDFIYQYVVKLSNPENAPKITGMIIDLQEADLVEAVKDYNGLKEKVKEGEELLQQE